MIQCTFLNDDNDEYCRIPLQHDDSMGMCRANSMATKGISFASLKCFGHPPSIEDFPIKEKTHIYVYIYRCTYSIYV